MNAVGEQIEAVQKTGSRVILMARQGKRAMCGQTRIIALVSFTMPPQSGSGGGSPRPRKPRMPMVMVV